MSVLNQKLCVSQFYKRFATLHFMQNSNQFERCDSKSNSREKKIEKKKIREYLQ